MPSGELRSSAEPRSSAFIETTEKLSERGPQEVESVEEVERVETVKIASRLKKRERLCGLGPSLRAVHFQERGNTTTVRLAFEMLAPSR